MIRKTLEVSISKEEIRTVDESGTKASTWVKIGQTVELEEGDLPDMCIKALRAEIQPEVDAWLLDQGGLILPPSAAAPEKEEIPEIENSLSELFPDVEIQVTDVTAESAGKDVIVL
ncbi:MAG: hypothetical protein DPW09_33380 [Anaerolineae bacterium]|nr:hypothetical protein [Anaerolineales bacterium]MCQ3978345.1 hypothetical protein [Anaerolineae bacterium]